MDIRLDIMANGMHIIYNLLDDLMIEEPCEIHFQKGNDGSIMPTFMPLLMVASNGKVTRHPQSLVLYSTYPNTDLHNIFIETLNQARAQRSGIVAPTKAQVLNIVK